MSTDFYWVVRRYTAEAGGMEGVITASPYLSKESFDKFFASDEGKKSLTRQEVIEQGVTEEWAIELVKTTPPQCRLEAARQAAINPKTGVLNEEAYKHELDKAWFAIMESQK